MIVPQRRSKGTQKRKYFTFAISFCRHDTYIHITFLLGLDRIVCFVHAIIFFLS